MSHHHIVKYFFAVGFVVLGFASYSAFAAEQSEIDHKKMMQQMEEGREGRSSGMGMGRSGMGQMGMMGGGMGRGGMMNMMHGGGMGMMGRGGMMNMMQWGGMGMMGMSPCGMGAMGMMGQGMMNKLDLSDDQRKKMNTIRKTARRQHLSLMGAVLDARDDYQEVMRGKTPDPKAVGTAFSKWAVAKQKVIEACVKARNDKRAILTEEQRKMADEMRGSMGSMGMGRGGMMGGMMQ